MRQYTLKFVGVRLLAPHTTCWLISAGKSAGLSTTMVALLRAVAACRRVLRLSLAVGAGAATIRGVQQHSVSRATRQAAKAKVSGSGHSVRQASFSRYIICGGIALVPWPEAAPAPCTGCSSLAHC